MIITPIILKNRKKCVKQSPAKRNIFQVSLLLNNKPLHTLLAFCVSKVDITLRPDFPNKVKTMKTRAPEWVTRRLLNDAKYIQNCWNIWNEIENPDIAFTQQLLRYRYEIKHSHSVLLSKTSLCPVKMESLYITTFGPVSKHNKSFPF